MREEEHDDEGQQPKKHRNNINVAAEENEVVEVV